MKLDAPKRRIVHDVIDLIPSSSDVDKDAANHVVEIPISWIQPYHNHLFRLYEGDRLNDMVESIKKNGVLNPVIVLRLDENHYEMLAGHNRMNASKLAGLTTIPAIVKENLSEEEGWLYVVETNLLQRGFSEMQISERAAVIAAHYGQISNQGKRNDIERELLILEGRESEAKDLVQNSRKALADEYSLSPSTVARLLRINQLIPEFKSKLDKNKLQLVVSVEISYLTHEEQRWLDDFLHAYNVKLDRSSANMLHQKSKSGTLTEENMRMLLLGLDREKDKKKMYQSTKIPKTVYRKYFTGKQEHEISEVITKALEQYFANK